MRLASSVPKLKSAIKLHSLFLMITGAIAVGSAAFGEGTGPIFLDTVECAGCEENLLDCPILADENSTCQHDQDAGVICPG